jgi:hypothetical protein
MICPQCKAEYRQGFTECSDCHISLVASLPTSDSLNSKPIPGGPLVPLWEADDLALHTSLLEELDAAGIRYFSQPMGTSPGVRRGASFPIQPMVLFGYQVGVLSSDLASAKGIVARLLNERPADVALPASREETGEVAETRALTDTDATCEVWAGGDEKLTGFLQAVLGENAISFRVETVGPGQNIRVHPLDEVRAREIIREIVEGTPPT